MGWHRCLGKANLPVQLCCLHPELYHPSQISTVSWPSQHQPISATMAKHDVGEWFHFLLEHIFEQLQSAKLEKQRNLGFFSAVFTFRKASILFHREDRVSWQSAVVLGSLIILIYQCQGSSSHWACTPPCLWENVTSTNDRQQHEKNVPCDLFCNL